ncbi:hypothetical protein C900_00910 [Fulvivirga imtechensis AK7]|uniref:Uncharacterized protein n=1 Tax=Fulvivirga imtechensis AK7 TaxID=1237149 RepID=L8JZ71_9BACT|nr:hypothetical protein [Fulvivirga imtechensis]ELR72949.1 hypothetical protein C900_00910 [Fulvivirga imtechensis AK7]
MKTIKDFQHNELDRQTVEKVMGGEPVSDGYEEVYYDQGGVTHVYHCRNGNCVYIRSMEGMIA